MQRGVANHPQLVQRRDDLLWSINERLAGNEGLELPRLGLDWMEDTVDLAIRDAEEIERIEANLAKNNANRY